MADSFNYISYGSASVDLENEIVLGRGRLFEYTAVETAKRLERMDSRAVEFLKGLPTFLCSEISRPDASMVVRFGRMEEIQVDTKRVLGFFVPIVDFGRIAFEDERSAREAFGADEWQLHRTHWAVRSGDADVVLGRLVDLQPGRQDDVESSRMVERPIQAKEPPPLESNVVGSVCSVDSFLRLLYDRSGGTDEAVFYRGHQDPSYQLSPSLMRKWPDGTWKHLANEHTLCKELLIAHDEEFAGDRYCFDRLVRMQHYGLPTRLLDITGNPLVALFFACHHTQGPATASGEVIVFRVDRQGIRYYDSDIVSCLANLSNLTSEQKNAIDLTLEESEFNDQPAVRKLLYEVRSEKGNFEARMSPTDLGTVICVKAKRTNTRIRSQDGAFLLFGHDANLPEFGTNGIGIERIEVTDKAAILAQLASIGIGPTTVYPSIEQTAGHLRELWLQPQPD